MTRIKSPDPEFRIPVVGRGGRRDNGLVAVRGCEEAQRLDELHGPNNATMIRERRWCRNCRRER